LRRKGTSKIWLGLAHWSAWSVNQGRPYGTLSNGTAEARLRVEELLYVSALWAGRKAVWQRSVCPARLYRGQFVESDLDAFLIALTSKGDFQALVDQVVGEPLDLVERDVEQFDLHVEIHALGTVQADQAGMEFKISVEALVTWPIRCAPEIDRVFRHERVIACYDDRDEVPILSARKAAIGDARRFLMPAGNGAMDELAAEALVDEELHALSRRRAIVRFDKIFAPVRARRSGGLPCSGLARA